MPVNTEELVFFSGNSMKRGVIERDYGVNNFGHKKIF